MIGRITVVKSLIIPNITYIASVTDLDKTNISKFKKMIFEILWNNRSEKVKRSTLCTDYTNGGLRVTDIDKYIDAIKINWVKRLITPEKNTPNWKYLTEILPVW